MANVQIINRVTNVEFPVVRKVLQVRPAATINTGPVTGGGGGGGTPANIGPKITVGDTAPADPAINDLWYDTTAPIDARLKYFDGTDFI